MAQFIMPPTGAGLTMDPYAGARMRNEALMNTTQNIGSSLGTLLQAVETQRANNYNKRFLDSVLGGGDVKAALAAAQGEAPRSGLMGIMNAFNPNLAPSTVPDMQKVAGEAIIKNKLSPEGFKPKTFEEAVAFEEAKRKAAMTPMQQIENTLASGGKVTPEQETGYKKVKGSAMGNQAAIGLRKEFRDSPVFKNYQTIDRMAKAMDDAYKLSTDPKSETRIAADQALGVTFQKMLDPTSVVRESEYARTPEGASLMNRLSSVAPQLVRGGLKLSDTDRRALLDMGNKLLDASKSSLNEHIDTYSQYATDYGVDPKLVIGNIKKLPLETQIQPAGVITPPTPGQALKQSPIAVAGQTTATTDLSKYRDYYNNLRSQGYSKEKAMQMLGGRR